MMKRKVILVVSVLLLGVMGCSDFGNPLSSETPGIMESGGSQNGSGGSQNGSGGSQNGSGGSQNG